MTWECSIEKVENGFLATYEAEYDDGSPRTEKFVFEQSYDEDLKEEYKTLDNEKIALAKMIKWLSEYFGYSYDKYSKENLNIAWDKAGHRYIESIEEIEVERDLGNFQL